MPRYLIALSLPESHASLVDPIIKSAVSFFETAGRIERKEVGSFRRRAAKGAGSEVARLVLLGVPDAPNAASDLVRGRTAEGILRQTLGAAGVHAGDVRVFLEDSAGSTAKA
jgi:hypothetical protein